MSGTTALVVRDIVKQFGNHRAVEDMSFTVSRGLVYGILGPNGAGKTTMLRMINDIIAPDAGEIEILDGMKPGEDSAHHIGYLPEERGLYKKMTIRRLLRYYARLKGTPKGRIDAAIDEWMERMELRGLLDRQIETLSKGMSQKV